MRVPSRRAVTPWLIAALLSLAFLATLDSAARADPGVKLVRTYRSDVKGTVFEVCRGRFDPPATDPENPVDCEGTIERWSEKRWQAYNAAGSGANPAAPKKEAGQPAATTPQPEVAHGAVGKEAQAAEATIPYGGSLDPTSVLGVTNPLCAEPGELSPTQMRNCAASRSPESAYPVGNFGWDIHVEGGGFITTLFAPAASFVLQLFSILWLVFLLGLKGCLILLGFTLSLSPFTNNRILAQIGNSLTGFYAGLTEPWLATLFVILGAWGLYNGLIRRRAGETIGGMIAAAVMMLAAVWIIQAPRQTIGTVADIVNRTALVAISAPSSGQLSSPLRSYDDATAALWDQMTAVPFCAMDFSDVHWCLHAKPSKAALQAARNGLSTADPFTIQLLSDLPEGEKTASRVIEQRLIDAFGPADSIRDLYLRFSPQSGPRDALWKYFAGEPDSHVGLPLGIGPQLNVGGGKEGAAPDKVSMQGRAGIVTRMVLVSIFVVGLLGGLLLLLWLAIRLLMAAAASFVLVLATPLVMFFPVFGLAGRTAFIRWATSLLGAVVSKLTFSALLGIVMLGSSVLGAGIGKSSPTLGLIATMGFWWAVFLGRDRYLSLLQIDPIADHPGAAARVLAGGYVGYRVASAASGAIKRRRGERDSRRQTESRAQVAAVEGGLEELAEQRLDAAAGQARVRADSHQSTQQRIKGLREDAEVQDFRRNPTRLTPDVRKRAKEKVNDLARLERGVRESAPQTRADSQLLSQVERNRSAGLPRYSRSDIEGATREIRREAQLPADRPAHNWRAEAFGLDPASEKGKQTIKLGLENTRAALGSTTQGDHQVKIHRPWLGKADRSGPLSMPAATLVDPPRRPASTSIEDAGAQLPKAKRRISRARDWLSR